MIKFINQLKSKNLLLFDLTKIIYYKICKTLNLGNNLNQGQLRAKLNMFLFNLWWRDVWQLESFIYLFLMTYCNKGSQGNFLSSFSLVG